MARTLKRFIPAFSVLSAAILITGLGWLLSGQIITNPTDSGGGGGGLTSPATLSNNGIGAVSTDALTLSNTTAAAVGAQQWSPRFHLIGAGWKTTATAASQTLDWIAENQPIQGTANAINNIVFSSQTAGGGYLPIFSLRADGTALSANDGFGYFASNTSLRGLFIPSGVLCQGAAIPTTNAANGCDGGSLVNNGFKLRSTYMFAWGSGTDPGSTLDTGLSRTAAGIVGAGTGAAGNTSGSYKALAYLTDSNCTSSASPAVCGSASAGTAVIAAAATTVVVNTTAVTANSEIKISEDSSLGAKLSVTCNTQSSLVVGTPRITARTAATSFTVSIDVGPTTNPLCFSYQLVN